MTLTNAQITSIVEATSKKMQTALQMEKKEVERNRVHEFNPSNLVNYLLSSRGYAISSLEQLNQNWAEATRGKGLGPRLVDIPTNPHDAARLLTITRIQLTAITAGFEASREDRTNDRPIDTDRRDKVRVERVYYYGGYHHCHNDTFWRDMYLINLLTRPSYPSGGYFPSAPVQVPTGGSGDEDGIGVVGYLVALLMIGAAAVTIGYAVVESYKRCNEIINGEDILGNLTKLTVTGVAAWQGAIIGAMIGAAMFHNPILGAVCASVILAAVGMKLAKMVVSGYHSLTNDTSAIANDPRFCLSDKQSNKLFAQGYDPEVVKEAIREVGVLLKANNANGIMFWNQENSDRGNLVKLMRDLKAGFGYKDVVINGKSFNLMRPIQQYTYYQPLYTPPPINPASNPVDAPLHNGHMGISTTDTRNLSGRRPQYSDAVETSLPTSNHDWNGVSYPDLSSRSFEPSAPPPDFSYS